MNQPSNALRLIGRDGKEYPVTCAMLIGRAPECNIVIDETGISRHHAQVEFVEGRTMLKDLGSRNGTFVNDVRIETSTEIKADDRIRFHDVPFTVKPADPAGVNPTAVFESAPAEDGPKTVSYQSLQLYSIIRGDNGAEIGVGRSMKIGRAENNEVPLPKDTSASQAHAKLEMLKGQVVLTDLGSSNGTWVNGVRITTPVYLTHGDKFRIGDTVFRLREGEKPLPAAEHHGQGRGCWLIGCGSLLALGMVLAIGLGGASLLPQLFAMPTPTATVTATPEPTSTQEPTVNPGLAATQQALAENVALRALVHVIVRTDDGTFGGSGSLLDSRGYVLTNFHVLGDVETGKLYDKDERIRIGLNWEHPDQEPDTFYNCEIVEFDEDYDLALLKAVSKSNGDPLPSDLVFPTIPIGDSDTLRIGDPISILGYPGLGGNTPTFTRGTVSGFLADNSIDQDRGWIKTDAEVNRGNSGGMAINAKGELIGIPTMAAVDTEVTGKISEIRPINLARIVTDAIPA
ncbi:MAG: FHA domain-containing protein [Anaerolineales bacterium]|nr:FHA domain-containing protein [Anaerolineales bacterium]